MLKENLAKVEENIPDRPGDRAALDIPDDLQIHRRSIHGPERVK